MWLCLYMQYRAEAEPVGVATGRSKQVRSAQELKTD